jgi:uncharacterized membrane protein YgcG
MRYLTRIVALAAVAAFAVPAMASAAPVAKRGIVVQRDVRGGAVVLATPSGGLLRVSLAKPKSLAMGSLVRVSGTKISVLGHRGKAKVRGVVVRRSRHAFALAGNGSVLAVASTTPPTPGQVVSTTVQVTPSALSDDDGQMQVEDNQAPSAELHGTVLSQDATTLTLTVNGFPAGLPIALGTQAIPALAVGTPVEARVALGPDPSNPSGIVLTLVSLHVQNGQQGGDQGQNGNCVKAEGQVTAVVEAGAAGGAPGSITVAGEHGDVTFIIPAGFGPTGVAVGDQVEAKGTAGATPTDQPTLVRLETKGGDNSSGNGNSQGDGGSGGNGGSDNSGGDN